MSPFSPASRLLDRLRTWPVESQQGARRNAMVASTALAARRAEREDVESYFEALVEHDRARDVPLTARR